MTLFWNLNSKNIHFNLLLMDFIIGIKTKAPDMRIITMRGPSICGVEVRIKKQSIAQNRVSTIHCVLLSGLLMIVME